MAAATHCTIFSLNARRNKNGNTANAAKKMRYHVNDNEGVLRPRVRSK